MAQKLLRLTFAPEKFEESLVNKWKMPNHLVLPQIFEECIKYFKIVSMIHDKWHVGNSKAKPIKKDIAGNIKE